MHGVKLLQPHDQALVLLLFQPEFLLAGDLLRAHLLLLRDDGWPAPGPLLLAGEQLSMVLRVLLDA